MTPRTRFLGVIVIALAAFSLYLAIANLIALFGTITLPLEGRLSNDFVLPLAIFSILGSLWVGNRRLQEMKRSPVPNPNDNGGRN